MVRTSCKSLLNALTSTFKSFTSFAIKSRLVLISEFSLPSWPASDFAFLIQPETPTKHPMIATIIEIVATSMINFPSLKSAIISNIYENYQNEFILNCPRIFYFFLLCFDEHLLLQEHLIYHARHLL